jgi:hypothetical protein
LVFSLCKSCAILNQKQCDHIENERAIEGTWVTEEVKLAISKGYKILNVYAVWHFEESIVYNKDNNEPGLFGNYVDTFLKLKQQSSGYPEWCKNEVDRKQYIQDYYKNENILLEEDKIVKNPGMRSISKLFLNSFWGRYCIQTNKTKYKMVTELSQVIQILISESILEDIHFLNDYKAQIFYTDNAEMHAGGRDSNIVVGAFTTCYGRMVLYKELDLLQDRVMYFDTDSIIFLSKDSEYEPELGDYLGKFTNELKQDVHIVEYVSAGPKNYGFLLSNGESELKVKGFGLNYAASQKLNFKAVVDLVLSQMYEDYIKVKQTQFSRNKKDWTVHTSVIEKAYRVVYDKRILNDDFTTKPFGFKVLFFSFLGIKSMAIHFNFIR